MLDPDERPSPKAFAIFVIAILAIATWDCSRTQEENRQRKAEYEEFKKTDRYKDLQAESDSFVTNRIVVSPTGKKFYKGHPCSDCQQFSHGFDWAYENGITNDNLCENMNSQEAYRGCSLGAEAVYSEIQNE